MCCIFVTLYQELDITLIWIFYILNFNSILFQSYRIMCFISVLSYHVYYFSPIISCVLFQSYRIMCIISVLSYHVYYFSPIVSCVLFQYYRIMCIISVLSYQVYYFSPIVSSVLFQSYRIKCIIHNQSFHYYITNLIWIKKNIFCFSIFLRCAYNRKQILIG